MAGLGRARGRGALIATEVGAATAFGHRRHVSETGGNERGGLGMLPGALWTAAGPSNLRLGRRSPHLPSPVRSPPSPSPPPSPRLSPPTRFSQRKTRPVPSAADTFFLNLTFSRSFLKSVLKYHPFDGYPCPCDENKLHLALSLPLAVGRASPQSSPAHRPMGQGPACPPDCVSPADVHPLTQDSLDGFSI